MTEFTTKYNGKNIAFSDEGIRYDDRVFIKYDDMEDIIHRTGVESAIIFKYKEHLVKMKYDPKDELEVSKYIDKAMEEPEVEEIPEENPLEKFAYLDEEPEEEPKKKKSKKGLIIAGLVVLGLVALFLILF